MSELKSRTARSSAKLVKQMLRDMRWHAARLDDPASVESVLTMAGTLSESVKKLSQILGDPTPANETQKTRDTAPKIGMEALKNFIAVSDSGADFCPDCGGVRKKE